MLNNKGFDLWADHYDQTVQLHEDENLYPFAGYKDVLNTIFNKVMQKRNSNVLDIGFGTGVLTSKLYEKGHHIDGVDFSSQMISIALAKMPHANLLEWDITKGVPPALAGNKYDSIISTYTLHHLTDQEKVSFLTNLQSLLKDDGAIFIGDVAFETREQLELCREDNLRNWDHDEFYFVYNELRDSLNDKCTFEPTSFCSGVCIITK